MYIEVYNYNFIFLCPFGFLRCMSLRVRCSRDRPVSRSTSQNLDHCIMSTTAGYIYMGAFYSQIILVNTPDKLYDVEINHCNLYSVL